MNDFNVQRNQYAEKIENELSLLIKEENVEQKKLIEAMRYSLLGGGKRVRGTLVLAFADLLGGNQKEALACACAIEMIHCYSLIHDDLPAMDDDDYRRGKLSNHKKFDEATAILAGDALLTHAFSVISEGVTGDKALKCISTLSQAAGYLGMCGGQVLDIAYGNKVSDEKTLRQIDSLKTGALIKASCRMGCIISSTKNADIDKADIYAETIGLAFQIVDDLLDADSNGSGEPSYVSILGVDESKKMVSDLTDKALEDISCYGEKANFLKDFAIYLKNRIF